MELKVVNDTVESIITFIKSWNSVLAKHEDQKQYLLKIVEKHREDSLIQTKQH